MTGVELYKRRYNILSCDAPKSLDLFQIFWFSTVAQSCLTLCDAMDCSTPGFPVHHQLPELTQTHVHWVGDATQPSRPLSSLLLLASIFPSIRVFSSESALHIRWTKYWSFSSSISSSNEYSGLISRTAWAGEVLWEPLLPGKDLGKNGYGRWLEWFRAYTECWWVKDSTVRRLADYKAESQNAFLADMSSGPPVLFSRVSASLPFFLSVKKNSKQTSG